MNKCPYCGKEYPDDVSTCELDGYTLQPPVTAPPPAEGYQVRRSELKYVAPLRAGVVIGALYGILALIFVPFVFLALMVGIKTGSPAPLVGGVFVLVLPLIYGVLGFVCGFIAAAIYNAIAKVIGGFVFEVREVTAAA
jgi:hypothetical protein